jgi:hypothetical protein
MYAGQFVPEPMAPLWFGLFIDMDVMLANQLAELFPDNDGALIESRQEVSIHWWASETPAGLSKKRGFLWIFGTLLKSFFTFAVLSLVATFVFRIGMMASAVFVVIYGKALDPTVSPSNSQLLRVLSKARPKSEHRVPGGALGRSSCGATVSRKEGELAAAVSLCPVLDNYIHVLRSGLQPVEALPPSR